jgi:hypothetical protein
MTTKTSIVQIQNEVSQNLVNKEVLSTLLATTFKGLSEPMVKQAMVEGMMRGYTFNDFLEKNIYAIPYGSTYNLVNSIDHARKIGMRSGVVGSSEPSFVTEGEGKIVSCSMTIKRRVGNDIGEFTATVYFSEYTTGANLWVKKPRTMIAKVAEMHALRKACPEEFSQIYVTEELDTKGVPVPSDPVDPSEFEARLRSAKTMEDLLREWSALSGDMKIKLEAVKNEMKAKLTKTVEPAK